MYECITKKVVRMNYPPFFTWELMPLPNRPMPLLKTRDSAVAGGHCFFFCLYLFKTTPKTSQMELLP
jgi:hypothetical protein